MAVPDPASFYEVHLHFAKGQEGWQEKHYVVLGTGENVPTRIAPLILARLLLLPAAAKYVYGRYSRVGAPRDRHRLYPINLSGANLPFGQGGMDGSLTTPPTVLTTPKTEVCIEVQLETAAGAWGTKFVRCLPSTEFSDDAIVHAIPDPVSAFVTPVTGNAVIADWPAAFVNYMAGLRDLTVYASKRAPLGPPPGAGNYDSVAWTAATVRQVATRKTGRPFGQRRGRVILR